MTIDKLAPIALGTICGVAEESCAAKVLAVTERGRYTYAILTGTRKGEIVENVERVTLCPFPKGYLPTYEKL